MADAAVTILLENLSHQHMTSCADLISGAEDELQLLKNAIELLGAFLQNAASKPTEEERFGEMGRRIKEVIYDAQDTIDYYMTRAAAAQGKIDRFRRRRRLDTEPVCNLAEEVRSLREEKLKPLMLDIARIDFADVLLIGDGSDPILEEPPHQIKLKKVESIFEDRVVGFEDEHHSILSYMMEDTAELCFIPIIGMPGLGKTTLARKVFQDVRVEYEFPTRIWVYVSKDFNRKDVLLNILKQVTSKDMSGLTDHEIASAAHEFLMKIKFLLVLDDVWDIDAFTAIRDALPIRNMMGKVIITSRFVEVGRHSSPRFHNLRFLTSSESWALLQFGVFGDLETCPQELIGIGEEIVNKCHGLPLLIVIVGGILVELLSIAQSMSALRKAWRKVSEYMTTTEYSADHKLISRTVELSFDRLPDDLRNVFLYLGMFPEDYEISATTLTRLWIGEGLIRHKDGQSLEEIAEETLSHLINRKLVIADKMRLNGKVKTCRLHDLVRDFCIAKGCEMNLFREILRNSREGTFDPPVSELQRHCRLCIHSDLLELFSSEPYIPGVRSFLCFYKTESRLLPKHTRDIPGDAFELLRVLDIKPIRFTRFPLELTQLFCLRYIVLSSDFGVLPEAVSMLRNIQTLIIHTSKSTLEIKADIWKMMHLRHVKTNASIILRKEPENPSDQELQTLTHLSPENCTKKVLDQARCLKKLGIRGTLSILVEGEVGSRKFGNLDKLKDLENLKLLNDVHIISPSAGRLPCLPPRDKFPPKLRRLTLSATSLSWEHMSVLETLENLEVLKLKDNAFVGECWEVMDGSFPSLQVLHIGYTDLVIWRASGHNFPRLRCLALRNCEKLENLPNGLATVLSLKVIELLRPNKTVAASARDIEEERLYVERNSRIRLSIYFPADDST